MAARGDGWWRAVMAGSRKELLSRDFGALFDRDFGGRLIWNPLYTREAARMGVFCSEENNSVLEVDKVAPFLLKLYEIVSSPVSDDLVCWSEHGETFKIVNRTKFAGVRRTTARVG
eukprot:scaffold118147_cov36-Phaeocystis_antarctica.AAC.1